MTKDEIVGLLQQELLSLGNELKSGEIDADKMAWYKELVKIVKDLSLGR